MRYPFTRAFDETAKNSDVWDTLEPSVQDVLQNGGNTTVAAYGAWRAALSARASPQRVQHVRCP